MNNENENIEIRLISLYLSGEASPEEMAKLMQWKDASDANLALFNSYVKIWQDARVVKESKSIDVELEWQKHKSQYINIEQVKNKNSFGFTMKIAAGLAVLIGLSFFAWNYFSKSTVKTDELASSEIVLPDNSVVTLNANSKLTYSASFGKKDRNVFLKGEAYFKVTKNPNMPFVINTGSAEVKVLGTSFNVKAYKDMEKVEVTVAEGRVSVKSVKTPAVSIIVSTGQKAVYNKTMDKIESEVNSNINYMSWKTKSMVFDNAKLPYVLQTISEVYHVDIVLESKELEQCTLTTSFENTDLPTVLKVLKSTFNISATLRGDKIVIRGKACQ